MSTSSFLLNMYDLKRPLAWMHEDCFHGYIQTKTIMFVTYWKCHKWIRDLPTFPSNPNHGLNLKLHSFLSMWKKQTLYERIHILPFLKLFLFLMSAIFKHAEHAVFIYSLPPAAVFHYPEAAFQPPSQTSENWSWRQAETGLSQVFHIQGVYLGVWFSAVRCLWKTVN